MKKLVLALFTLSVVISCQKKYDTPPLTELPDGSIITLDSLIGMYTGTPIKFTTDVSVYATVTMDEEDGNIYKSIYVQDETAAINVRLQTSGGMYAGDYIRIALKGTTLSSYNGVMQLDSVDTDKNLIKQEAGKHFTPKIVTIDQINVATMQSQLIKLENVQFSEAFTSGTYADAANQKNLTIKLTDCFGREVNVRTSGFANFAGEDVAQGNGSLVAIVGVYSGVADLYIRSFAEVKMAESRCTVTRNATLATITDIKAGVHASGTIVKILDVQYENTTNLMGDINNIVDCDGNTLKSFVWSSDPLGSVAVPTGNGPIYGEIELYNGTWEIKPATTDDIVEMTNTRCSGPVATCDDVANGIYLMKDFNDASITTCGWTTKSITGTANWATSTFGGATFAKISNWSGSANVATEAWLISPAVDLLSSTAPKLSFTNANNYTGDSLTLFVSTDYDGTSAPSTATWTNITSLATWDTDYSTWADPFIASGNVDLTSYKSATVYIAFKYIGTASNGATWELDDVQISE